MTRNKIISLFLSIVMLISVFPLNISAADDKAMRTIYLHAQGENPQETTNNSTIYMGEDADIYFAVDNPNKGYYENNTHIEPQYDMNGYTLRICYDSEYFEFKGDLNSPIDYTVPDKNFDTNNQENVGDDINKGDDNTVVEGENGTTSDIPQSVGYFVYRHGSGTYTLGSNTYNTAYITVLYSGGYVPQKEDGKLWYNLAKLSLTPIKTGSTDVFIDIDSGDEEYALELFAKNKSDNLSEQTFDFNAINGGYHHILIKDKSKPVPPIAKPTSGSYVEKVTVELTQEDNLPIYYTKDGSEPKGNTSAILYTAPIEIDLDTEIKTCAYRASDGKYSSTVSYEYKILPDRPYLFNKDKVLLPDINSFSTKTNVYVSDKNVYDDIADDSEVYYTFSNIDVENPVKGDNPETSWVKVSKQNRVIEIDNNTTVRLITEKMGKYSEPAIYYFSIKPLAPAADKPSNEYAEKIDVRLSCGTEGAKIYYTIDGSDPKTNGIEYTGIPITLAKDTTLRAISLYNSEWSDKVSYYYLFKFRDDYGVDAFYPSGVYEGSVNVTLTPNNPDYTVMYRIDNGEWKKYTDVINIGKDTDITAKAVELGADGTTIKPEGDEYVFTYKIKPMAPEFSPESTQFTNTNKVTIFTPESTESNTDDYTLYYTEDGSDPITSPTRKKADETSDSAVIEIDGYKVITAAVLKKGESWSNVVKHSYDIVTLKPVKPLTTLPSGSYIYEIGGEAFATQFMPVSQGTKIYYTISYDGGLCPDPIPNTDRTYLYDGTAFIDIKGNTVIKAVAVNVFGVKSDVGIFSYTVTPKAPKSAPSATINATDLPVVPVDAVKGSTVKYKIGGFENVIEEIDAERFYINTKTGMAYRDKECTQQLGNSNTNENTDSVTLEISSTLNSVESDINRYTYTLSSGSVFAAPYADKETGTYEERRIDSNNNILKVMLYSLNDGGKIQYRLNNTEDWKDYDGNGLLFKEDAILQLRYEKNGSYSSVVSYVYNFVPLAPIIELPSGTYLESDGKTTTIDFHPMAPTDKTTDENGNKFSGTYKIFYRQNGDIKDYSYKGQERSIKKTMSFKAYVLNEDTGRVSENTIHYYIIESGNAASGIYIAQPYNVDKISAHLLGSDDYAEGIKLLSYNNSVKIHYRYSYISKSDGKKIITNDVVYDVNRPIIPTTLMDDITIEAWLEDENGKIEGSDSTFKIDFVHLGIPTTSLEASEKVEFSKGTKYTLVYPTEENVILYYTLDGSDPTISDNPNRKAYSGEELTLNSATTVKTACFSAGVYGPIGVYKYTVPTTVGGGGGGGGGGKTTIDKTRKYTTDIFGNEHPTHISYINGYPDGRVLPEGNITREEITAILYRITNHQYEKPFVATGDAFTDVTSGRWSAHDIEYMADRGIVNGYPDGEFKPSKNLSRAEFAVLVCRFAGIKETNIKNSFVDLEESHWAYDEILALANSGLIEGYPDKSYKPENNITRAEVMTVVNKLLGRNPQESYVKSLEFNPYNDLYENKWYYTTVLEATVTHNYWLDDKTYEYKWEDWK